MSVANSNRADQEFEDVFELFASLLTGSTGNLQVSGPVVGFASDVLTFHVE